MIKSNNCFQNQTIMSSHSALSNLAVFLTSLLFIVTVRSDCQTCVDLSFYSCKVCYRNCQQNKTLSSCQHTYCSSYSSDQNGTQTCNSYDTETLAQNQCFKTCCASEQNYFSIQQLNRCEAQSKKNTTITIAVVCSVFGTIFLIVIGCMLYHGCCSNCGCGCLGSLCDCIGGCCGCICQCLCYVLTCKCFRRNEVPQVSIERPNNIGINNSEIELMVKPYNIKWQNDNQIQDIINDSTNICSVCLSSQVNTLTRCHHGYHYDCLLLWFNKNPHCPLCISDNINEVKFYCRGCCIRYVKLDLKIHKEFQKIIKQIKGPNCQNCQ